MLSPLLLQPRIILKWTIFSKKNPIFFGYFFRIFLVIISVILSSEFSKMHRPERIRIYIHAYRQYSNFICFYLNFPLSILYCVASSLLALFRKFYWRSLTDFISVLKVRTTPLDPADSGLNAFAKIVTALVLMFVSVMVFAVVYKFVRTWGLLLSHVQGQPNEFYNQSDASPLR